MDIGHGHHMVPAFQVAGAVKFCARGEIDEKGRIDASGYKKRSKSLTTRSTVTRNGHCYSFDRSHSFHLRPHAITPAIVIITLRLVCEKFDLDNLELFSSQLQLYTATISGNISWFNKMWSKHRRKNVVICLIFLKIRIFFSLQSTQSLFSSK